MRLHQWDMGAASRRIILALAFGLVGVVFALAHDASSRVAAQTQAKLDASIFSYDGQDFVRTKTTLVTAEGKSAVGTKLDHGSAAYNALVQGRSWTGEATVFGKKYDANYAPLTGADGKVTGALFVATRK